jgi:hypothetical protein
MADRFDKPNELSFICCKLGMVGRTRSTEERYRPATLMQHCAKA